MAPPPSLPDPMARRVSWNRTGEPPGLPGAYARGAPAATPAGRVVLLREVCLGRARRVLGARRPFRGARRGTASTFIQVPEAISRDAVCLR